MSCTGRCCDEYERLERRIELQIRRILWHGLPHRQHTGEVQAVAARQLNAKTRLPTYRDLVDKRQE